MEWFVLTIGLIALTIGAALAGRASMHGAELDNEAAGQPVWHDSRRARQPGSPVGVPPDGFRPPQAQAACLRTGWEDWCWEPANLHRPALSGAVTPDITVLIQGVQATVPVTLPHPWIAGTALPISTPPAWLSSLKAAASQTRELLLWPWRAGNKDLPEQFAILVPARKLPRVTGNPEDPRLALSSLVILDLRLGLPQRLPPSADGKVSHRSRRRSETEDTLAQIIQNLRSWSGGVPVLAGIPATSELDLEIGMLASTGFDGAVVFASPFASGLPLPLSGSEVGLPLARALAIAGAARARRGLNKWPLLVAGPFVTPADCLKALAFGVTAVILDVALAWPEVCTYQEQGQQAHEQAEMEVDQADDLLASTLAGNLADFRHETESLLRLLGCRRLSELTPQLLTAVGEIPGPHEPDDYVPPRTATATPTTLPPSAPGAAAPTPSLASPPGAADTDRGRTANREFVRPRVLSARPLRRIRVLTRG
ncbi:MAG: hypothetical protein IMX00_07580 [Limnochordales bacterium]|nr:hypothetical protein [Limnochordales bacterium]